MYSIAHKVDLFRNIFKMYRVMPDIYRFHPQTFLLPQQFADLKSSMLSIKDSTERTFIIKPDRGAQGKGIFLIQDPDTVSNSFIEGNGAVAQQYIKPYLIDGLKFDLRIYVLVTSVEPLRVYIHKEGMARFCTETYEDPNKNNLDHCYSHLTNYSLNKQNDHFNHSNTDQIHINQQNNDDNSNDNNEHQKNSNEENTNHFKNDVKPSQTNEDDVFSISQHETPFKRSLSSIMNSIRKSGKDADQLQNEIDDIIRFTMASIQPFLSSSYHSVIAIGDGKCRCFEILGFDILIDYELRPWLLEVNFMPSLTTDTEFDRILKYSVIKGALKIVDIKPDFKKLLKTRQKNISQGKKKITLYDPEIESKIARENTNWRQLLPIEIPSENSEANSNLNQSNFDVEEEKIKKLMKLKSDYEKALAVSRDTPLGAAAATSASKAKMAATLIEINERKKKFSIPLSVRNPSIALKNPLPPLNQTHLACFSPKFQQLNLNLRQQSEKKGKNYSIDVDSISSSKSEVKLNCNTNLNLKKKPVINFKPKNIKFVKLSSSLDPEIFKSKQVKIKENTCQDKIPTDLQGQPEIFETNSATSGELPLFLQFSGAKQNQLDMFEEEKRIATLKSRLDEEKSLGIVDKVYDLFRIKKRKDPTLKCSIISKKITKPIVAFKQIFNENVII